MAATVVLALTLVAFAALRSDSPRIALYFCSGLAVIFAVFLGLGHLVTWAARRMKRPRRPELALAVGNLGAPGGLTRTVVLSLGSGLSLLVAVALADASLVHELQGRIPEEVAQLLRPRPAQRRSGRADQVSSPVRCRDLRSRLPPCCAASIVKLKDKAPEDMKVPPEAQWVLGRRPWPFLCRRGAGRIQGRRRRVVAQGLCWRAAGLL